MSTGTEAAKVAGTAAAGAGAGFAASHVIGGVGLAVGGTAVEVTLAPFVAIGCGVALTGRGVYKLGKWLGGKGNKKK